MENELMNNAMMEEVAKETIPATQAIMEEAITPAAEAIAQETIPAIETALKETAPAHKHSSWKTAGLLITVATCVGLKLISKPIKNHKEKKEQEREAKQREQFNRWYDERRAQEIAQEKAAQELIDKHTDTTTDADVTDNEPADVDV